MFAAPEHTGAFIFSNLGAISLALPLMQLEPVRWWEFWRGFGVAQSADEPPLRAELFSADQMEQHGRNLAAGHRLSPRRTRDRLLARLADNEEVLVGAGNLLKEALEANQRIAPAGE